jgi:ketosteroid isomerase-like protein
MIPCSAPNRAAAASAASTTPELRIRRVIAEKDRALRAKDLEGVLAHYDSDRVSVDPNPSVRIDGSRGLRRVWQACLPHLPSDFHIETRDLVITVAGELAVMHRLFRVPEVAGEKPGWIREIAVFRLARGQWRIVHEHCSIAGIPVL